MFSRQPNSCLPSPANLGVAAADQELLLLTPSSLRPLPPSPLLTPPPPRTHSHLPSPLLPLQVFSPSQVADTLWALASLRWRPGQLWVDQLLHSITNAAATSGMGREDMKGDGGLLQQRDRGDLQASEEQAGKQEWQRRNGLQVYNLEELSLCLWGLATLRRVMWAEETGGGGLQSEGHIPWQGPPDNEQASRILAGLVAASLHILL